MTDDKVKELAKSDVDRVMPTLKNKEAAKRKLINWAIHEDEYETVDAFNTARYYRLMREELKSRLNELPE